MHRDGREAARSKLYRLCECEDALRFFQRLENSRRHRAVVVLFGLVTSSPFVSSNASKTSLTGDFQESNADVCDAVSMFDALASLVVFVCFILFSIQS